MSYSAKYRARIFDLTGNTYTVYLKQKDYQGPAFPIDNGNCTLVYRGSGRDETAVVIPSEATFDFHVYPTDLSKYDELFESQNRDWQLEIVKGTGPLITSTAYTLNFAQTSDLLGVDPSGKTGTNSGWLPNTTVFPKFIKELTINETISGGHTWKVKTTNLLNGSVVGTPETLQIAVTSSGGGSVARNYDGTFDTVRFGKVERVTNGGVALGDGNIGWYKNGILQQQLPFYFGQLVSGVTANFTYDFTNISGGDYLEAHVNEFPQAPRVVPVELQVLSTVTVPPTWHIKATSTGTPISLTTVGSDTKDTTIITTNNQITVRVTRTGSTAGAGSVQFIQSDGVDLVKKTTSFGVGTGIDTTYVFTANTSTTGLKMFVQESYTTPPPLPANTGSGSGTISAGGGLQTISIGGFGFTYSTNPIPATGTVVNVTPLSSIAANTTPITITLRGTNAISVNSYTMKVRDTTTSTDYGPSISGNLSNFVIISFNVPKVSNHTFQLSGTINITGG